MRRRPNTSLSDAERLTLAIKWLRAAAKAKRATGQRSLTISLRSAEEITEWLEEYCEAAVGWEELAS